MGKIYCHFSIVDIKNSFPLPITDLRNMFIVSHLNISAKAVNSLPVISTLCPINWVVTCNDRFDGELMMPDARYQA